MKLVFLKKKVFIWSIIGALLVIGLILALYFAYREEPITKNKYYGAVVANGIECALIGTSILKMNGSAVDAAIATLFCEGISCPQSMGLGGGFLATIYKKSTQTLQSLDARESAPLAANSTMFSNKTEEEIKNNPGLYVAVPGELRGYYRLHQKYGVLDWKTLVEPSIKLCKEGHLVTGYLAAALKKRENDILQNPSLKEVFINPETGHVWQQNDLIKRPKLAKTLELIAEKGQDAMYDGGILGKQLAEDIQKFGGIITERDFMEYDVKWREPIKVELTKGYKIYSSPLPGSGSVLAFILNILHDYLHKDNPIIMWQRIIESFKHAYGLRTLLGGDESSSEIKSVVSNMTDINFAKEIRKLILDNRTYTDFQYYGAHFSQPKDYGTANIAVMAPNGDAITVTSTINSIFGAVARSEQTGIILNNEMDDFSIPGKNNSYGIPPSPANFIQPKRRPLSSMCPSIILDHEGNVKLLIGSAGGSKITTSIAEVIIRHIMLDEPIYQAVQARRLHHQLAPMTIQYEDGFNKTILNHLASFGHNLTLVPTEKGFSSLTAISQNSSKNLIPVYDNRRNGSASVMDIEV